LNLTILEETEVSRKVQSSPSIDAFWGLVSFPGTKMDDCKLFADEDKVDFGHNKKRFQGEPEVYITLRITSTHRVQSLGAVPCPLNGRAR
jgi:hypothetical protein